ncbi:PIG-L family deacetylase, partial [Mesorhizobium sp. M2E.F.Ca.ET.154.01.1.1]
RFEPTFPFADIRALLPPAPAIRPLTASPSPATGAG